MSLSKSPRDWNLVPDTIRLEPQTPESRNVAHCRSEASLTTNGDINPHFSRPTNHFGLDIFPRVSTTKLLRSVATIACTPRPMRD